MEKFQEHLHAATKAFQTADHLTYVTYPLLKEVKLIVPIAENLYSAVVNLMDAVLEYDKLYKRIDLLVDNFDARLEIFKSECSRRYNIPRDYIELIAELRNIIQHHKKSPMEFIRGDKFVIASSNYSLKTVNLDNMKKYLAKVKQLTVKVNEVLKWQ